ncbi:hypothetical protein DL764_007943 [Monosporascus ibericus]|uniref:Glycolipid 2-alpha-mannosyltransferase n=1 Tax=Monosporascus ibericus TaxID=155417 RepID=A0A4Q4SYU0_9PEZI|nr:hypothetical protein DL764_007943 [Monosporascus ibericus]
MVPLRRLLRSMRRRVPLWVVLPVLAAGTLEVLLHAASWSVPVPAAEQDAAFFPPGCREPDLAQARANAAFVMLARNSERREAKVTVRSIERQFNAWYGYPIVFLNDEEWDPAFVSELNETAGGKAVFEVIPRDVWSFPDWVDPEAARRSIKAQGETGLQHAGQEGYHHMCRFYSGKFYQLPALQKYKWYWRLEPDVEFLCAVTYDPFVEMERRGKVYGFTIALWELGDSCPSLFREAADWMDARGVRPTALWRATVSASWAPWPLRRWLMSLLAHRDARGDAWSLCHYWSNFEIADMDFFRSREYQAFFDYLDRKGGFYFERWGDAAVHSIAVAMYADPAQVHHFEDIGYRHDHLYQCPANAPGEAAQLPGSEVLARGERDPKWTAEEPGGIGCRCECDRSKGTRNHPEYCLDRLKRPNTRKRRWITWPLRLVWP